ncbi:hypothetical protein C3747_268g8 [Trypanosoma cruzi]|uniref:Uncharacterized protein n=2 Tax=Trypanosoma cruzi TaxID=5693 RepID=Q4DS83_TRYCC|nr:hypothetical protein, conserved [Trypanosoma cruzi]EAN95393.1 hypothetical protein, conserved [Trypanosoma cruzi]KAF5225471.1 hypothetical protein ECC02_001234 [Trypanosoma cruzi]PWU95316.1 hypothetical protein C3747_268g8 [Trypanosoma cruzi]|eukprot:XP_817244.1 hypothetical protein [Trypanosoma cruzi strain CL Brener]
MPSLLGAKRAREELSACERSVAYRVSTPLRCGLSFLAEGEVVKGAAFLLVGGHSLCSRVDKGSSPFSSASVRSRRSVLNHAESRLVAHRHGVCRQPTVSDCSGGDRTPLFSPRQVQMDVTRGDTGRHYRFTFFVPAPDLFCGGEKDKATGAVKYRNAVVRELLNQVSVEAALTADREWDVVFHGKNVLFESGAESLMSALLSDSCQRIPLALFYGLETE